jgi:hypothetical protein
MSGLGRPLLAEPFGSFGLLSVCLKSSAPRTTGVRCVAAAYHIKGARLWPTARGQDPTLTRLDGVKQDAPDSMIVAAHALVGDVGNDRSQSAADVAQRRARGAEISKADCRRFPTAVGTKNGSSARVLRDRTGAVDAFRCFLSAGGGRRDCCQAVAQHFASQGARL